MLAPPPGLTNDIQKFFLEESRLGIPVIFHEECLHGHAAKDSTSFPQPIGLAATFDPGLVERSVHDDCCRGSRPWTHQALDAGRRCRARSALGPRRRNLRRRSISGRRAWAWPRCAVFRATAAFKDKKRVIATLKHFVGARAAGIRNELRSGECFACACWEKHFCSPFSEAIKKANAISVMASYNEVDGEPSHASRWLLRDVLRKEWGFAGFIVSDYYAIWELSHRPETHGHFVAKDKREACRLAVRSRRQHRTA